MLATAIFAMVATALAVCLNGTIGAGLHVQRETGVLLNLESRLAEARLTRLIPGKGTSKPDAGGIVYELEISLLDLKNDKNQPLNGLYALKITARWKEQNQDEEQVARTYVFQP